MSKAFLGSLILSFALFAGLKNASAATYPLEIIQPQPNLTTASRYYRAYPGLEYKVPVGVYGGAYPFTYSLISAPSGMSINPSTGIVTWPNPTAASSPHTVTVFVRDAEGATASRSWTISVSTSGFIFVDDSAADGGDGSISRPFNSMVDFYGGTDYAALHNTAYANYFVYWRAGTYAVEGYEGNTGQQGYVGYPVTEHPHVWLAYPGEAVTIDLGLNEGRFINISSWSGNELFVGGIRFTRGLNHIWRLAGPRIVFYDCDFETWGPGIDGSNSAALLWYGDHVRTDIHTYNLVKDCTFSGMISGTGNCFLKIYSATKLLIEGNVLGNVTGTSHEGIAVKGNSRNVEIRANTLEAATHVIGGNFNDCRETLIRFNNVKNAASTDGASVYGALTLNYQTENVGPVHIERNTFEGNVIARELGAGDGPFHFRDNVIVNENAGDSPVQGSHINCWNCADPSVMTIDSPNLAGYASNGMIDYNGLLQGSYRTQYLGLKGHELGSISPDTTPPAAPTGLAVR